MRKITTLDLEKAIDLVWQEELVHKQKLPTGVVKLIYSYLIDRNFKVGIQDRLSTSRRGCLTPSYSFII